MTEEDRPEVPEGVLRGIEDLADGSTASKEDLEEALGRDGCPYHSWENIVLDNNIDESHLTPTGPPERVWIWPELRCGVCSHSFWTDDEPTLVKGGTDE